MGKSAARLVVLLLLIGAAMPLTPAAAASRTVAVSRVGSHAGPTRGGVRVSVWGHGFRHVRRVFFGRVAGRSVHVISSRHLTVVAPAHAAGAVNIRVRTTSHTSRRHWADRYTYIRPPSITSITPSRSVPAGGRSVTITGADFHRPAVVRFGTRAGRSVRVLSTRRLTVVAPAHTAGTVNVRVTTPFGTSRAVSADRVTYHAPPTVSSVVPPSSSSQPGQVVMVTGSGFTTGTTATLGGQPARVTGLSSTRLQVQLPQLSPGVHVLRISTPYASAGVAYTIYQGPVYYFNATAIRVGDVELRWYAGPEPYPVTSIIRRVEGTSPPPDTAPPLWTGVGMNYSDTTVVPGTTYTYSVVLSDGHGHVSTPTTMTLTAPRNPDTTVTGSALVDPPAAGAMALSCVSSGWCAEVDTRGSARTFDGASWSRPTPTGTGPLRTNDLSCASESFCVAVGTDGTGAEWDGASWTPLPRLLTRSYVLGISCPVAGWCVAVAASSEIATLSAGAWHVAAPPVPTSWTDVDCASTSSCVAVAGNGAASAFDGHTWSTPTTAIAGLHFNAVSCATTTNCSAVGFEANETAYVTRWTAGSWSPAVEVDATHRGFTIACGSADACVVGTADNYASDLAHGSWSAPRLVDPIAPAAASALIVGCASPTACIGVDPLGGAARFDGTSWSSPVLFSPAEGDVTGLSCSTSDDCVLVDGHGYAAVKGAGGWAEPVPVMSRGTVASVSCTEPTFCAAAGSYVPDGATAPRTGFVTYDGDHWSAPTPADPAVTSLSKIACVGSSFCLAVGERNVPQQGRTAVYQRWDGQNWSTAGDIGVVDSV